MGCRLHLDYFRLQAKVLLGGYGLAPVDLLRRFIWLPEQWSNLL